MGRNPGNFPILAGPTENSIQGIASDPAWIVKVDDDFSSNASKWDVAPYQNYAIQLERNISNGTYNWNFQVKTGYDFWDVPQTDTFGDFVASLDVQHPAGPKTDSYGMVFRVTGGNYYTFSMNEKGQYYVWLHNQGKTQTLLQEVGSFDVKPGKVNNITVKATGPIFTFYVNNHLVGTVVDSTLPTGKVGVYVSPASTYGSTVATPRIEAGPTPVGPTAVFQMDNFKVWVPKNDPTSKVRETSTPTPQPGRIVYVTDKDGNREIYSMKSDGTDSTRLTNNQADDFSPKWSPTGDKIAFVSTRDGNPEIYVMNRGGSNLTRITNHPEQDLEPCWSPTGQEIVFTSNRDGNYEIYIHHLIDNSDTRITNDPTGDRYPDWSPDGKLLLIQSWQNGKYEIFKYDLTTNSKRLLMNQANNSLEHATWSPSGLAYLYEERLPTGPVYITTNGYPKRDYSKVLADKYQNIWPAWSPNGTQVLFASNRDGQFDLYIMNVHGGPFFRLTNNAANESEMDWTAE